jgi:dTDP-4-dehydrorhamnose 3,5-epimerase
LIFKATKLKGAFVIEPERKEDERGYFARTFCEREFAEHGLRSRFVQCNTSFNRKKGTLRGMHFQAAPNEEAKLVSCTRGAIFDAIIDLRADSPTYREHVAVTLSVDNGKLLYIPEGFAHGFQTLEDDSEIFYQMSQFYHPESARGVRWNDPAFQIEWPPAERIIIARDQEYPLVKG